MTLGRLMEGAKIELDEAREGRRANARACVALIMRARMKRDLAFDRESIRFGWLDLGEAGA